MFADDTTVSYPTTPALQPQHASDVWLSHSTACRHCIGSTHDRQAAPHLGRLPHLSVCHPDSFERAARVWGRHTLAYLLAASPLSLQAAR